MHENLRFPITLLATFFVLSLATACSSASPPQAVTPASTPEVQAVVDIASPTMQATPTPGEAESTATVAHSVTSSPTPAAVATESVIVEEAVTPTATITSSAQPTVEVSLGSSPTPLPPGWYDPGNFSEDVNPLTGERVDDPSLLMRRPIAIKVSNYPAVVRPQAGLNNADLVFEHYAEGGVTRFTAVFYGRDAHTVGSVRSARIIDFEIPQMYDAAFGFSGAAGANKERFSETEWFERIISPDFGDSGFYRAQPNDPDTDFWHTMFTDTYRLRDILIERGQDVPPQFRNGMTFSEQPPPGGSTAKQVEIGYRGSYVTWWYDSGVDRYFRWNDGDRHDDANTDQQINFKNIAVIAAEHVDTWIPETEVGQGAKSIEIQLWGEGPASIFRDGQRFDGRWRRQDPKDMITFTDLDGNTLPLGIGNTWFQVVPTNFDKLYVTS